MRRCLPVTSQFARSRVDIDGSGQVQVLRFGVARHYGLPTVYFGERAPEPSARFQPTSHPSPAPVLEQVIPRARRAADPGESTRPPAAFPDPAAKDRARRGGHGHVGKGHDRHPSRQGLPRHERVPVVAVQPIQRRREQGEEDCRTADEPKNPVLALTYWPASRSKAQANSAPGRKATPSTAVAWKIDDTDCPFASSRPVRGSQGKRLPLGIDLSIWPAGPIGHSGQTDAGTPIGASCPVLEASDGSPASWSCRCPGFGSTGWRVSCRPRRRWCLRRRGIRRGLGFLLGRLVGLRRFRRRGRRAGGGRRCR